MTNTNNTNSILLADSYKYSQPCQYPPKTRGYFGYGEARYSTVDDVEETVFVGLQMFIKAYLLTPFTYEDIDEATEILSLHMSTIQFPKAALRRIVENYNGYWPVTIKAVKEGTKVPVGNALYTVEVDLEADPDLFWVGSFLETAILKAVWYPTTVATISKHCKNVILKFLNRTCDNPGAEIGFKLHDFGYRGVSSNESAGIGGLAHLVNFFGTDTVQALLYGRRYYNCNMAGFSIPASEHSTMSSWGKEREISAYSNMLDQYAKPGQLMACVSDTWDIFKACEDLWGGKLKDKVIASGATLVIRPDSGEPLSTVLQVLKILDAKFGSTLNGKGYKVLNNVRVIQGDGVNPDAIDSILYAMQLNRFSAENIAFGMGGGLLQNVNRDTFGFAMKCSSIKDEAGNWIDVYKDPVGGGKTSKKGRLGLYKGSIKTLDHGAYINNPSFVTMTEDQAKVWGLENQLELVYQNGKLFRDQTLDEMRELSNL